MATHGGRDEDDAERDGGDPGPRRAGGSACAGGLPAERVDRGGGQDRQPRPGHQRRPEVVAADVRVVVGRGEEAGDRGGRPGQERVARAPIGRHHERDRDEQRQDPELVVRPPDQLAELARQVPERVVQAALELLGEDDVPEAVPGVRRAVHERRPERSGAERQLGVDEDQGHGQDADARQDEPAAPPDPRIDREDVQPDRDRQEQRERVIADGQREHEGRGDQVAVAAVGSRLRRRRRRP